MDIVLGALWVQLGCKNTAVGLLKVLECLNRPFSGCTHLVADPFENTGGGGNGAVSDVFGREV